MYSSDLSFEDLDNFLLSQGTEGNLRSEEPIKIIHQIWFGTIPNKRQAKEQYKKLKDYRDSWIVNNPDWIHIEWDKESCDKLVSNYYLEYQEQYKNYPYEIQRCDLVRYFILYRYGGLYADMDYICCKPWNQVLNKYPHTLYLVESLNTVTVSNSLMYSKYRNLDFWKFVFLECYNNSNPPSFYPRHLKIMCSTGPVILNRLYRRYKLRFNLKSYPHKLFHPYGVKTDVKLIDKEKYYAIHLGKGSWEKKDSKFLLFVFRDWKIVLIIILIFLIPIMFNFLSKIFSLK